MVRAYGLTNSKELDRAKGPTASALTGVGERIAAYGVSNRRHKDLKCGAMQDLITAQSIRQSLQNPCQ